VKAPFPYFGGKSAVASLVWQALGRPAHYIEPFFGSGAVLLLRPDFDPASHTETVCDLDGHLANVWRALQADPDAVARWCDWPVNHADLIARKAKLNLETVSLLERLCADDSYFDAKLAGYWIWAVSCWIGHGLISPNQIPHIGNGGMGVHAKGQIPHISDSGIGVHRKSIADTDAASRRGVGEAYNTNLYAWFRELSERLRYVRVVCGDWSRVCGGDWQADVGTCGLFFDPPYSLESGRNMGLYSTDDASVAHDVREWCRERADRKDHRIVLAGYYEEHDSLIAEGWTVHRYSGKGGYGNLGNGNGKLNRHREALFFSPHCLRHAEPTLFDAPIISGGSRLATNEAPVTQVRGAE